MNNPMVSIVGELAQRVAGLEAWREAAGESSSEHLRYLLRIEDKLDKLQWWLLGALGTGLLTIGSILLSKGLR